MMAAILRSAGMTHIGLVRRRNEDAWVELPELGFYAVADGMGGHRAGDVASQKTIAGLMRLVEEHGPFKAPKDAEEWLAVAIPRVNRLVFDLSLEDHRLEGMGSTLCCLCPVGATMVYAHVGDSRVYLLRDGILSQLTRDHSLVAEKVASGQMTEEEAAISDQKNIITRAIGTKPRVVPQIDRERMRVGDRFLACSDGLTDMVTPEEIQELLNRSRDPHEATLRLISAACEEGGKDNITVVVVDVEG